MTKPKIPNEKPDERKGAPRTIPREPVRKPVREPVKEPAHVENFGAFYNSKYTLPDPVRNYHELNHASEYSEYFRERCYF